MQNTTSVTQWAYCLGCGAWQATVYRCRDCGSSRLTSATDVGKVDERTGTKIDGSAVRVLVDVEVRSNGEVRATRLYTDRLTSLRHDAALLSILDSDVHNCLSDHVDDSAAWAALHLMARDHVRSAISQALPSRWSSRTGASQVPIELNFRLFSLKPDVQAPADGLPWLEVVSFDDSLVRSAASFLKTGNVKAELYESVLSLADGGDRLQLGLRIPVEAVVSNVVLCLKDKPSEILAEFDAATFIARDQLSLVLDVRLSAPVLWRLSPESKDSSIEAELRVSLRGLEERPVRTKVPCGDLGQRDTLVDVFLDLGSTTTKYIIRVGDSLSLPQTKGTAKLAYDWSLPHYDKAKILADKSGAEWSKWLTELLPALRRYAAREYKGYLRSVYLTLPQSGMLDVVELSKAITTPKTMSPKGERRLDDKAVRALIERAEVEAVGVALGGQVVVLIPEHEAIARHYLAPLDALHKAALQYQKSFSTNEEARAYQQRRQEEWDDKRRQRKEYEARSVLWRLLNAPPDGPTGKRPPEVSAMESPAAWMHRLAAHPELLSNVVILDAGGLSLDIAVLESNMRVPGCSKSDATCGGEAVSRKLAERKNENFTASKSKDWTQEKARLGVQWSSAANTSTISWDERFGHFGGPQQRAYREVTRELCTRVVSELASALAARWARSSGSQCTVLLTGGGSRNPHFQELVADLLAEARLNADVVDARALQDLLVESRSFKPPLPELLSPPVELFTTVHGWAYDEERGATESRYDKYAVVGGLLSGAKTC
jgi:hypothetical protein